MTGPHPSRRDFLAAAALAAAGASARGAEPGFQPPCKGLKLSIAAYSYRKYLKAKTDPMTLDDFVERAAAMKLDAVEPTSYYFRDTSEPYLKRLRKKTLDLGLDISGTAVGNDFAHPPGPRREGQIAHVKRWVDHAVHLGAPVIRIFAGHQKKGQTPEQAHKLMVEAIQQCCAYAGQHKVALALENHGGPTTTGNDLLRFVRDVQSPWFGINLDTGNFRTPDPYADMAAAAPHAFNVQVKVELRVRGKTVPSDYARIVKILRDANYNGYLALEYEAREDPLTAIPRHVKALREALGAT